MQDYYDDKTYCSACGIDTAHRILNRQSQCLSCGRRVTLKKQVKHEDNVRLA